MISRRTGCPLAVGPNRGECVEALLKHADCDLVISDDGLQHHSLAPTIEIVVIDGVRRFGNGRCLPAGPLRESVRRLREADLIVCNGIAGRGEFSMKYIALDAYTIKQPRKRKPLAAFETKEAHVLAGIGNPERFFSMVKNKGIRVHPHPFPDHHRYRREDLHFDDGLPVIMTEKDAVKCESIASDDSWFVPVTAELPEVFGHRLASLLERAQRG
jgi:tetraacyldisaccharide 4'-kinase